MSDSPSDGADLPDDVSIERADTDDADRMADLWVDLAAGQRKYGSHLHAGGNRDRMHELMLQHVVSDTALVARRDETVVGFITYGQESENLQQQVTRGLIHNLYVEEGHRGEGIGSELLTAAEAELTIMDVDAVALQAMAANERARNFYRRHGYQPHRVELEKSTESDSLTTDDRKD